MRFGIKTLDDFDVCGSTVLCRIDINQPVDREREKLKSTARIAACLPTVRELSEKGAKVVLLAHQGSDIEYNNFYTTRPHADVISELLGFKIKFVDDVCGPTARSAIGDLKNGEILLLDNVRFCSEEQTLFEMKLRLTHEQQTHTQLVEKLAPLADLYVCDAFAAAHRDQPSLCAFEYVLPSAMGRLFEKEYSVISELMENPKRRCTFVLGGSKVSDAFMMMEEVLKKGIADTILIGGLLANILLIANGFDIGSESLNFIKKSNLDSCIDIAKKIYYGNEEKIILPVDVAYLKNGVRIDIPVEKVPADACITDIGINTAVKYQEIINNSATVFVNGPMGVFEQKETGIGTKLVWDALGSTEAYTVIGGGDSITATAKYDKTDLISYICTGGGALIRFLTGEELPVIKALRHAAKIKDTISESRN